MSLSNKNILIISLTSGLIFTSLLATLMIYALFYKCYNQKKPKSYEKNFFILKNDDSCIIKNLIDNDNLESLKKFLSKKFIIGNNNEPNNIKSYYFSNEYDNLLHYAAEKCSYNTIKYLVDDCHFDIRINDEHSKGPLNYLAYGTVYKNKLNEAIQIIDFLVDKSIVIDNTNTPCLENDTKFTALSCVLNNAINDDSYDCSHFQIAKTLLNNKANPNIPNEGCCLGIMMQNISLIKNDEANDVFKIIIKSSTNLNIAMYADKLLQIINTKNQKIDNATKKNNLDIYNTVIDRFFDAIPESINLNCHLNFLKETLKAKVTYIQTSKTSIINYQNVHSQLINKFSDLLDQHINRYEASNKKQNPKNPDIIITDDDDILKSIPSLFSQKSCYREQKSVLESSSISSIANNQELQQ